MFNVIFSPCTVCLNQTHTGNTLDLRDTQVLRALHLPVCHKLQVALLELLDWVWVQLVNRVLQTLTQLQLQGRHRDSGLGAIRVLIIRITGVVSSSFF